MGGKGSGGARHGTGPKPLLDPETREFIRRDCEQRANALRQAQATARLNRRLAKGGLVRSEDGDSDPVHDVPLHERRKVIKFGINDPDKKHLPEEISEEARSAIDFMREHRKKFGTTESPRARLATGRQGIIAAVARDWGVTPRMVRTIWEETKAV